jgi:hypothetical protein
MKLLRALALSLFVCSLAFAQATLMPMPVLQFSDVYGAPLAGGFIYTCVTGSSCPGTPLAAYTDSTGATPLPNPIVLNAAGEQTNQIWLGQGLVYKVVVTDLNGVVQSTTDPVVDRGFALSMNTISTSPAAHASQSISGPLSLGTYGLTAGPITSCVQNAMYVVGSSCYANFAAARAAAGTGCVLVPPTYAGTDGPADGNTCILDLRRNAVASSHYFNCVYPLAGASGGADCGLVANGAGDLWLSHNTQVFPATTTTTSLVIGANTVTVASTALFGAGATSPLQVGRETPNSETVQYTGWSVIDATHLSIVCVKAHTPGAANNNSAAAVDIEELGLTILDAGLGIIVADLHIPSQLAGRGPPAVWLEGNGDPFLTTPYNISDAFPFNAIGIVAPITGFSSSATPSGPFWHPADLQFRNASSANCVSLQNSTGAPLIYSCDTGIQIQAELFPSPGGLRTLGDGTHAWNSLYVGGNGGAGNTQISSIATVARSLALPDANVKAVIVYTATTTSATSDAFTVQGLTASSICTFSPANASASTATGTYVSAVGANSFTLTHAVTAGMVFGVHCTY